MGSSWLARAIVCNVWSDLTLGGGARIGFAHSQPQIIPMRHGREVYQIVVALRVCYFPSHRCHASSITENGCVSSHDKEMRGRDLWIFDAVLAACRPDMRFVRKQYGVTPVNGTAYKFGNSVFYLTQETVTERNGEVVSYIFRRSSPDVRESHYSNKAGVTVDNPKSLCLEFDSDPGPKLCLRALVGSSN